MLKRSIQLISKILFEYAWFYFPNFAASVLIILTISTIVFGQTISNPQFSLDSRKRSGATIDPVTHALQLSIPLGVYPGRGGNTPVIINYSSKVWNMKYGTTHDLTPTVPDEGPYNYLYDAKYGEGSAAGWTSTLDWVRFPTYAGRERYDNAGRPTNANPYNANQIQYMAARIYVQLPDGSKHEMRRDDGIYQATSSYCTGGGGAGSEGCGIVLTTYNPSLPGMYYSVDGSGMKYDTTSNTLWLPDGSRYIFAGDANGYQSLNYYDRNGNILNYNYGANQWIDSLGRTFQPPLPNLGQVGSGYNVAPRDDVYQLPSLNTATQTYTMRWRFLLDPNTGETVLSDPSQQLLPTGDLINELACTFAPALFQSLVPCDPENGDNNFVRRTDFNPVVLSEIDLPNGQKYQFRYNIYGEIDKIIYPTGSYERFEYGGKTTISPETFDSIIYSQTNRGVKKRWVSENGLGTDEVLWEYGNTSRGVFYPTDTHEVGSYVKSPDGMRVESWWHQGVRPDTSLGTYGFEKAEAGKVYETLVYDVNGQIRYRTLTKWTIEGTVINNIPKTRNPRPEKQISIIFEPGSNSALVRLTETIYDSNTDQAYFASLNPKQVKNYNYKILNLATAQAADVDTISTMFSGSDLTGVSETDYLYDPSYKARGIIGLATETRVLNPANTSEVFAKSQFVYDEAAYFDNNYTTTNWENPNSNLRGNVTTTRTWNKDAGTWIESHAMFDNFGNVRKVWDTSGDPTRFIETEYDPIYKYAYSTKTKAPAPDPTGINGTTQGSEISRTYDFNTGLLLSVTDANGQTATTEYDGLLRPKKIIPPPGGAISETIYNDTPGNIWVKSRQQIDETNWAESTTFYDNLGRAVKTRTKDLQGDVMSRVMFDSFGRVEKTSNPYRVDAAGNPTETVYWSKLRYDDANRVVETYAPAPEGQTGQSLGTIQFGISTLQNLVGTYVVATDASGRKSRAISGIYGLMRVDEATGKGGSVDQDLGTLASPTQPTYYNYNIKGELTKITQGVQNRYFMYDSLGRLIRVRQPEQIPNPDIATTGNPENNQWTAKYTYDVFGNVVSVTDAKNITITNFYDKAGRTTKRTYMDGTPQVEFFYDGIGLPSVPQFSKGSLTKVTSSVSEDRFTSFDNQGRLLASQQITDGQTYNFGYKYNLSGGLIEQTYPSGRIVRNFLDGEGGLNVVTSKAANGFVKRVASDFDYAATGAVRKMKLGNGLWETAQFNQLQQLTQVGLGTTQTNNDLFKIDYEYGELNDAGTDVDTSKNIGMIARTTTTIPTTNFVQTFKYDELNRLTEAVEKTGAAENWKQTFGYDRFGNRTSRYQKIGSDVLPINNITHPTIDQTNNRFTTGQGYVYDFNGNLIQDAQNRSFTFNGDDKQTVVRDLNIPTTPQDPDANVIGRYFYDGSGARVKKVVPATGETTIFVYDAGGALAAEYSTQTPPSDPKTAYLTTDHLGSPRVITDASGQVTARRDFMPFGEELGAGVGGRTEALKYSYIGTDRVRKRFTGYEKDDETGLDFAEARMYQNKHGRFTAVDPLLASASALNPQTYNRYTYTGNDPINNTDPSGLLYYRNSRTREIAWFDENPGEEWEDLTDVDNIYITDGGCIRGNCVNAGDSVIFRANGNIDVVRSSTAAVEVGSSVVDTIVELADTAGELITDIATRPFAPTTDAPTIDLPTAEPGGGPLEPIGGSDTGTDGGTDTGEGEIDAGGNWKVTTAQILYALGRACWETSCWESDERNDDEEIELYRGVGAPRENDTPYWHERFRQAVQGIAIPVGGHDSPLEHNKGNTDSIFTSWTTNRSVAEREAQYPLTGVVLSKKFPRSRLVESPDLFGESEVLVVGPVTGASVTRARRR